MVLGSKVESGVPVIPVKMRRTVQSIKEVVGDHSDADIYAMLKETNMDPNETTQRLLNQDPFHEVRRKRDKRKENIGHNPSSELAKRADNLTYWTKSKPSWEPNARRGIFARNVQPGISHEFRVVRDNRVNQNASVDVKQGSHYPVASDSKQTQIASSIHENRNLEWKLQERAHCGPLPDPGLAEAGTRRQFFKGKQATVSNQIMESQKAVELNSQSHSSAAAGSSNFANGVYSSSSDPVHVPSPDSRFNGAVRAIGRETGSAGLRRPTSELSSQATVPHKAFPSPQIGKESSASSDSFGYPHTLSKSSQASQTCMLDPVVSSNSVSRPSTNSQNNNKAHPQPVGHQKAQSLMEWKPKLSKKSGAVNPVTNGSISLTINQTGSFTDKKIEAACLSEKLSEIYMNETEHVVIPPHLRVPDAERAQLTFGSFGIEYDFPKDSESSHQTFESSIDSPIECSESISESIHLGPSKDNFVDNQADSAARQIPTQTDSLISVAVSEVSSELSISLNSKKMDMDTDISLLQSDNPPHSPVETRQMQSSPNLPSFSEAYGTQLIYNEPFFTDAIEDNVQIDTLSTPSEAFSSHVANNSATSTSGAAQHQQPLAHQPVTHLYQQMQFPQYASYLPYRQFLPPMYVPPVAIPNYLNTSAYPHPPNTSNYLPMPGASSHLSVGGVKYSTSHYKPVLPGGPTGYANYSHLAGYTVGTPGTVGFSTVLDDPSRIKYKENNLYAPNPQVETSEIWVQTPRDSSGIPSAPFFNMHGQTPHPAYIPANTSHGSFNAMPQSHIHFQGLYHPPQPVALASTHHMIHQQLPPTLGGNVGVGVASPAPQVGAYQQPQLGHLNWTANF